MTSPLFVNKNLFSKHTKERSFTENKQYSSSRTQRQPREDLSRDSSLNSGVPATVNYTMQRHLHKPPIKTEAINNNGGGHVSKASYSADKKSEDLAASPLISSTLKPMSSKGV